MYAIRSYYAIMRLGSEGVTEISVIPSGSIGLDVALGVGGFPRGRVIEIYGPESSGKTTLALNAVAQAQKAGGNAAFIDAEHALDVSYASKLGVSISDLLIRITSYNVCYTKLLRQVSPPATAIPNFRAVFVMPL